MVFYPIPLAVLQEFNILILQVETSQWGVAANPPSVADVVLVPPLSNLKLSLLLGSALQRPLVLKTTPPYVFIMWLTGRVTSLSIFIFRAREMPEKAKITTLPLTMHQNRHLGLIFVRPHAGDESELSQSVVVGIKSVIYYLCLAYVE